MKKIDKTQADWEALVSHLAETSKIVTRICNERSEGVSKNYGAAAFASAMIVAQTAHNFAPGKDQGISRYIIAEKILGYSKKYLSPGGELLGKTIDEVVHDRF